MAYLQNERIHRRITLKDFDDRSSMLGWSHNPANEKLVGEKLSMKVTSVKAAKDQCGPSILRAPGSSKSERGSVDFSYAEIESIPPEGNQWPCNSVGPETKLRDDDGQSKQKRTWTISQMQAYIKS